MLALHLRTATFPHSELQPAQLWDTPDTGLEGRRVHQETVAGSQKRLTKCFRSLEVASE